MDSWINTEILFNPVNWAVVALVLIFGAFGVFAIYSNATAYLPKV
jgi:hypothetical protein